MRYRMGPRFAGMGIELQWDVDLLPICEKLDGSAMSELQFMLFEALSNVLQHARRGCCAWRAMRRRVQARSMYG